jgi:CHAD domain-containing protein
VAEDRPQEVTFHVSSALVVPPLAGDGHRNVVDGSVRLDTSYWDTADLRLARRGHILRHLASDDSGIPTWTLQLDRDDTSDPPRRCEVDSTGSAHEPPARLANALVAIVGDMPLMPVARVCTSRRRYTVDSGNGDTLLSIHDDRVVVLNGREAQGSFRQIEIARVMHDDESATAFSTAVKRLQRAGAGRPVAIAPLVRILGAAATPAQVPSLDRKSTIENVVEAALIDGLHQLLRYDPGVRLDLSEDDVHQARVAMRRLRSHLRTLRPVLDPPMVDWLRDEIRWAGAQLGEVRDLDVLHETFDHELTSMLGPARHDVLDAVRSERAAARARLVEAMNSERWHVLLCALENASRLPPLRGTTVPTRRARKNARGLLRKAWRRLERRAAAAEAGDIGFHEVRKAAKSTRYAAELLEPMIGSAAGKLARVTEDIQSQLGERQDAVVACQWLVRHPGLVPAEDVAEKLCEGGLDRVPIGRPPNWNRLWKRACRAADAAV